VHVTYFPTVCLIDRSNDGLGKLKAPISGQQLKLLQSVPYIWDRRPLIPIESRTTRNPSEPIPHPQRILTRYDPTPSNQRTKRWRHHG
jgi:hypothetical protein